MGNKLGQVSEDGDGDPIAYGSPPKGTYCLEHMAYLFRRMTYRPNHLETMVMKGRSWKARMLPAWTDRCGGEVDGS